MNRQSGSWWLWMGFKHVESKISSCLPKDELKKRWTVHIKEKPNRVGSIWLVSEWKWKLRCSNSLKLDCWMFSENDLWLKQVCADSNVYFCERNSLVSGNECICSKTGDLNANACLKNCISSWFRIVVYHRSYQLFLQMKMNVFVVDKTVVFIFVMENFNTASFKCHPPSQYFSFPAYLLSKTQDEVTLLNTNSSWSFINLLLPLCVRLVTRRSLQPL